MNDTAEILTDDELWAVLITDIGALGSWSRLAFALARILEHAHLAEGECWCEHLGFEVCLVTLTPVTSRPAG